LLAAFTCWIMLVFDFSLVNGYFVGPNESARENEAETETYAWD
jgi:hypothetical protein